MHVIYKRASNVIVWLDLGHPKPRHVRAALRCIRRFASLFRRRLIWVGNRKNGDGSNPSLAAYCCDPLIEVRVKMLWGKYTSPNSDETE